MKIKKYEVTDMKDALRQIKQDLGPDAVLLTTRKIMKPSGLGLFPRPVLEVTAAVEYDKEAGAAATATPVELAPKSSVKNTIPRPPIAPQMPEDPAIYTRSAMPAATSAQDFPYDDETDDDTYLRSLLEINKDDSLTATAPMPVSNNSENESLLPADEDDVYVPPVKRAQQEPTKEFSGLSANQLTELLGQLGLDKISSLADDVGEIKQQLSVMKNTLSEPTSVSSVDLPTHLREFYTLLLKNGLDELLCYRLLKNIERKTPDAKGKAQLRSIIMQALGEQIPVERDFASAMYRKITAFIGPTGVGKTTTLAKVAANLVLKYSQKVCLITADNFRIGAVEQLKTYADIVNLPLFVTTNPEELKLLLDDIHKDYDYILLDTTGRSPYDNLRMNDIAACLSVSPDIIPVVVMSMAGNHAELSDMFERYTGLEPAYIVFSKLDETRYYGPMANIPIKKKVPLLLLSTGQGVPDDLEIPDGKKIARKLLQEIPELWKEN